MIRGADGDFALGFEQLNRLREQAATSPQGAVKTVAQQFEAQFLQMLLKQMRDATPQGGLFDSDETRNYVGMLDQQLAQNLARSGVGLAAIIARQLAHSVEPSADPSAASPAGASPSSLAPASPAGAAANAAPPAGTDVAPAAAAARPPSVVPPAVDGASRTAPARAGHASAEPGRRNERVTEFVRQMTPHAEQAALATGIPAHFMVAQAALESGWGRHEPRAADGSRSFNLFGIKAGGSWKGATATAMTTEYADGVAHRVPQSFRAYASYAEAFADYARLMRENPRYAGVLHQGTDSLAFAKGLQRAGYATDPEYASKLGRILGRTLTA